MSVYKKAAASLLISVLLFAAFAVISSAGVLDLIETRFYNPAVIASYTKELKDDAGYIDNFLDYQLARFAGILSEPSVRRSFISNQAQNDILSRSMIFGTLQETLPGFQWMRFIDMNGEWIHYSTYSRDIFRQNNISIAYRNYNSIDDAPSFHLIEASSGDNGKLFFDREMERILFSLPLYDSYDVFRGTALFSVSVQAVAEYLLSARRIKATDNVIIITNPDGFLICGSAYAGLSLFSQVSRLWNDGLFGPARIESSSSSEPYILVSAKSGGILAGRLLYETIFLIPAEMKFILFSSFFLTAFLIVFLLFNIKQDSVVIIKDRIKRLQTSLLDQYYEHRNAINPDRWAEELEHRREEIRQELKKDLSKNIKNNNEQNIIDELIDKFWDDLLSLVGSRSETEIDEKKLRFIMSRLIAASAIANPEKPEELDELEAVEELEDNEEPEVLYPLDEEEHEAPEKAKAVEKPEEHLDIAEVSSMIEFSGTMPDDDDDEEDAFIKGNLEIASPFRTLFSRMDNVSKNETGADAFSLNNTPDNTEKK